MNVVNDIDAANKIAEAHRAEINAANSETGSKAEIKDVDLDDLKDLNLGDDIPGVRFPLIDGHVYFVASSLYSVSKDGKDYIFFTFVDSKDSANVVDVSLNVLCRRVSGDPKNAEIKTTAAFLQAKGSKAALSVKLYNKALPLKVRFAAITGKKVAVTVAAGKQKDSVVPVFLLREA